MWLANRGGRGRAVRPEEDGNAGLRRGGTHCRGRVDWEDGGLATERSRLVQSCSVYTELEEVPRPVVDDNNKLGSLNWRETGLFYTTTTHEASADLCRTLLYRRGARKS